MISPSFYGFFVSIGITVAILVAERRAKLLMPNLDDVWKLVPLTLLFGLVGARLYHIAHYFPYYSNDVVQIFYIWNGGLGIFGGLVGGFLGLYLSYLRLPAKKISRNQSFLVLLDTLAPAVPLAQAIGRLGNIVNNEIIPYAYFEIVLVLLIVVIIFFVEKVKIRAARNIFGPNGSLFFLYLSLYGFGRFFLEYFRPDNLWRLPYISVGQLISLLTILLSVSFIVYSKYKNVSCNGNTRPLL